MIECVAEFTTNHLGNMNLLLRMVEAAAKAGATSIKMQKKDVETFYSKEKLDSAYDSPYGKTYRDYRSTFEFSPDEWWQFFEACIEHDIPYFTTVQDTLSLEFMLHFKQTRYKIASSNARNWEFLAGVSRRVSVEHEIVLSVAGSTLQQIEKALTFFRDHKRVYLLHCVAEYPCPRERLRLGNIPILNREFGSDRVRIGYSGHEIGYLPSLEAASLGAEMIERHFCLSRHSFAHHIDCSLEPDDFKVFTDCVDDWNPSIATQLPEEAWESHFGMTGAEASFLEHQTYATEKLGCESRF